MGDLERYPVVVSLVICSCIMELGRLTAPCGSLRMKKGEMKVICHKHGGKKNLSLTGIKQIPSCNWSDTQSTEPIRTQAELRYFTRFKSK